MSLRSPCIAAWASRPPGPTDLPSQAPRDPKPGQSPAATYFGMHCVPPRRVAPGSALACAALLAGCASTTIALDPSPQAPVCERAATALVLWAPEWRPDQKDVVEREAAAAAGLEAFFDSSGCFARAEIRRIPDLGSATVSAHAASASGQFSRTVVIGVRELGPVVKLLSSAALVEGGTEVALKIAAYPAAPGTQPREFTVRWQRGGPGVVKGVASLPQDMQAALRAGLQPGATAN